MCMDGLVVVVMVGWMVCAGGQNWQGISRRPGLRAAGAAGPQPKRQFCGPLPGRTGGLQVIGGACNMLVFVKGGKNTYMIV